MAFSRTICYSCIHFYKVITWYIIICFRHNKLYRHTELPRFICLNRITTKRHLRFISSSPPCPKWTTRNRIHHFCMLNRSAYIALGFSLYVNSIPILIGFFVWSEINRECRTLIFFYMKRYFIILISFN